MDQYQSPRALLPPPPHFPPTPPPSKRILQVCRCFLCSIGLTPTDAYLHSRNDIHDFRRQTKGTVVSLGCCAGRLYAAAHFGKPAFRAATEKSTSDSEIFLTVQSLVVVILWLLQKQAETFNNWILNVCFFWPSLANFSFLF